MIEPDFSAKQDVNITKLSILVSVQEQCDIYGTRNEDTDIENSTNSMRLLSLFYTNHTW